MLGTELQKHLEVIAPKHDEMDILKPETYLKDKFDIIIHAAAYTDLVSAETTKKVECYMTNVLATKWLSEFYKDSLFVYISSEYAVHPANWYSQTKRMGEDVLYLHHNHLIIRTLFKPRPFEHPKACVDQWTQGDYVDVVAPMIAERVSWGPEYWRDFQKRGEQILLLGTGRKSLYELARQTRPDVIPCLVEDIKTVKLPHDYL